MTDDIIYKWCGFNTCVDSKDQVTESDCASIPNASQTKQCSTQGYEQAQGSESIYSLQNYDYVRQFTSVGLSFPCYARRCQKRCTGEQLLTPGSPCNSNFKRYDPSEINDKQISRYCNNLSIDDKLNFKHPCYTQFNGSLQLQFSATAQNEFAKELASIYAPEEKYKLLDPLLIFTQKFGKQINIKNLRQDTIDYIAQWIVENYNSIMLNISVNIIVDRFITDEFIHGKIDSQIYKLCMLKPNIGICSCSAQGLLKIDDTDQMSQQMRLYPQCLYGKCISLGYKNQKQNIDLSKCPAINVCNQIIDIDNVRDQSYIDKIKLTCSQNQNTNSQQTSGLSDTDKKLIIMIIIPLLIIIIAIITIIIFFQRCKIINKSKVIEIKK